MFITKRDGRVVPFDSNRIYEAVRKAYLSCNFAVSSNTLDSIVFNVMGKIDSTTVSVEEVQNLVEQTLMSYNTVVAKAYIVYRYRHSIYRDTESAVMQSYEEITNTKVAQSDLKRENGNIDTNTPMGVMLKYGSEGAKLYNLAIVIPEDISLLHKEGRIHIHDLDFYTLTTTCCQIDLKSLLSRGFGTGHGTLRPPKSIQSYSALACIAIQSNQNDQHGGQSVPNFDYAMADGVRETFKKEWLHYCKLFVEDELYAVVSSLITDNKITPTLDPEELLTSGDTFTTSVSKYITDSALLNKVAKLAKKMTEKHTYQAMESLIHNLNSMHSRAGSQVPFSSINYGTDTSIEGRLVIKCLLEATDAGLGNGEIPIFPIQIFKVKDGVNGLVGDRNYDLLELACKVSAKRLFPNFSFLDAPFNLQYYKPGKPESEVVYMGCRTRVMDNIYDTGNIQAYGRGNLSYTSINLPRLAIESKGNLYKFYSSLLETMQVCKEQLLHRLSFILNKTSVNFPMCIGQKVWTKSENLAPHEAIGDVWKHGTLSIGFIGLAETLVSLIGSHHAESEEAQKLGLNIIKFMRDYLNSVSTQLKLNFTLLATPAEGLSGRFLRLDRKKFGTIIGVTDKEYYTNSFHVPVGYSMSCFDKLRIEAPYHSLTNAGHISYVELDGDVTKNLPAMMSLVQCMKTLGVGYGAINHAVDYDPICGYTGIIGDTCPKCGRNTFGTTTVEGTVLRL